MALTTNAQASSSRQNGRARNQVQSSPEISDEERLVKPNIGADMDVDDDELEEWTIATYKPRTTQKDASSDSMLSKLLADIKGLQQSISGSIDKVSETAVATEAASEGDAMIEELAKGLCRSIEIKAVLGIRHTVIKAMQMKIKQGQEISDPAAAYEQQAADQTEKYMKKTPRQKFGRDDDYTTFRTGVWQVNHGNQACPPMSNWLDKGDGDESEEDDVEVGPTLANYKCAASHLPITNAMVNPGCNHHYSKAFVMQLFEQQTGRAANKSIPCPAVGCSVVVLQSELQPDNAFQKKADQHFRRETQRDDAVEDFDELSD